MSRLKKLLIAIIFEVVAVILAVTTGIFGAAGFFLQLYFFNERQFLLFQMAAISFCVFMGWYPLAVLVFGLATMALFFRSLLGVELFWRAMLSALLATTIFCLGLGIWGYLSYGPEMLAQLILLFTRAIEMVPEAGAKLNPESLIYQLPSYIFCLCAINIWLSLVVLRRMQEDILNFEVPEAFIWILIGSLLLSFVPMKVPGLQDVALNVLNISLLLYFFQGLSVLSFILNALRFSTLIKLAIYFIFILQILLPTCLGVLDYWFSFRQRLVERLSKKTEDEDLN